MTSFVGKPSRYAASVTDRLHVAGLGDSVIVCAQSPGRHMTLHGRYPWKQPGAPWMVLTELLSVLYPVYGQAICLVEVAFAS